jgi:lysozyme
VAKTERKTAQKNKNAVRKKKPAKKKKRKALSVKLKIILAGLLLILLSPFYYGYVVRFFSSAWQWISNIGENPNYRTYKSFNIKIPRRYHIHGIDVSAYQGKIDWHMVKAMREDSVQISFVFIKATEGLLTVDSYFQRNWREAAKAGLICGAYHYLKPNKNGTWQARFFLQNVKPEKGDLPMVVDIEELNGVTPEVMRTELQRFLKEVETKTKIKPIIYTGVSFYQDYLSGFFKNYNLWIAHYNQPDLALDTNTHWRFWQHSDIAKINGINHVVDFDAFRGDSVAFKKLLIQ